MTSETNDTKASIPKWIEAKLFEPILKENFKGYKSIREFKVKPGTAAGENYATIMLKVFIEVELEDSPSKSITFMLKTNHESVVVQEVMKDLDMFDIEKGMYEEIVPAFENLYANAGVKVNFGAKSYDLPTNKKYILLEDLSPRGFKNTNRVEGLNIEHMQCVLKRLAQWHAASAALVTVKGPYEKKYYEGYFKEESKETIISMFEGMGLVFLDCAKNYSNYNEYADDITSAHKNMMNELFKAAQVNDNEFNVLNHGDFWSNNVMFQYDDTGKVKETYLVDYQVPKYGTPAQDLLYLLMSSSKYELKLKQFDYFIKFYYDNLVENLKILKYSQKIPSLRDIHAMLYKYGIWGYVTAIGVMGAVLLDPTNNANLENFVSDTEEGTAFKKLMYSSDRYRKHMEAILPWLRNRGALSFS